MNKLSCLLLLLSTACGGTDRPQPLKTPPPGDTPISAVEGGTVELEDGTQVAIPPGALAEDAAVKLALKPLSDFTPLENGIDLVAVLEPAGTVLSEPATLLMTPPASTSPTEELTLFMLGSRDTWVQPEVSNVLRHRDGTIETKVSVLGTYGFAAQPPEPVPGLTVFVRGNGEPMAGVPVQLWTANEQMIGTMETDAVGEAKFVDLSAGEYFMIVTMDPQWCGARDKTRTYEGGDERVTFGFADNIPCG